MKTGKLALHHSGKGALHKGQGFCGGVTAGEFSPFAGELLPPDELAAPLGDVAVLRAETWDGDLQVQALLDDAEAHAVQLGRVRRRSAHVLRVCAFESVLQDQQEGLNRGSGRLLAYSEGDLGGWDGCGQVGVNT